MGRLLEERNYDGPGRRVSQILFSGEYQSDLIGGSSGQVRQ